MSKKEYAWQTNSLQRSRSEEQLLSQEAMATGGRNRRTSQTARRHADPSQTGARFTGMSQAREGGTAIQTSLSQLLFKFKVTGDWKLRAQANMMMAGRVESDPFNPATLRMALNAPAKLRSMLDKEACFNVIWDSGATITISNNKKDFVGKIKKPSVWQRLTGIARGLKIEGEGHVLWAMMGTDGRLRMFKLPALYIPSSPQRLLSTTSLLQTYPGETIELDSQKAELTGIKGDPMKAGVIAMVSQVNNLPTSIAYHYNDLEPPVKELNNIIATVHKSNINLSESEKELVKWHNRLGHLSHRRIQLQLGKNGFENRVSKFFANW